MSNIHSAAASALGYYFQGLFALVVLMDDASDDAAVSVETADDVVLTTPNKKTLHQLKHKSAIPPTLTIKSADLWRTLRIWSRYVASGEATDTQFVLVTVAPISENGSLSILLDSKRSREPLLKALTREALRVRAVRKAARGSTPQYENRFEGCEAFLSLKAAERKSLIKAIQLCSSSFDAVGAVHEVSKRLLTIPPSIRPRITNRLIEWWDRQIVMSLTGERSGLIPKSELQQQLHRLAIEYSDDTLPDNYGALTPDDWKAQLSPRVSRQIELVRGRWNHFERAARDLWRARNQRSDWLRSRISSLSEIRSYEARLIEEWKDRHDDICGRTVDCDEDVCCDEGLKLLNWVHLHAPQETAPIRGRWTQPFLVRGTYQILAGKLRVGWHPRFRELMKDPDESNKP